MVDKKEFRWRFWRRLVGRPVTVGSFGVSAVATTIALLVHHPLLPLLVAGGGLVAGLGSMAFNLMKRSEEVAKEVNDNMMREMEQQVEDRLDQLHVRLAEDNDTRDERMLADLRQLLSRFRGDHGWMEHMSTLTVHDMTHAAKELFDACVRKLERSVDLRDQARTLSRDVGRGLEEAREALLTEVSEGVRGLGELYALVEKTSMDRMAGRSTVSQGDVADVLDRFQSILEIDRRVEERMDREFSGGRSRDRELV